MINRARLNRALRRIDEHFDFVNNGGCCSVAAMLANECVGILPDMRITTCGHGGRANIDKVRSMIDNNYDTEEWYEHDVGFKHVWVEGNLNGSHVCLDATGVHEADFFYEYWGYPAEGSFTLDEVENLAEYGDWNFMFDRDQLPDIQHYIETKVRPILHAK